MHWKLLIGQDRHIRKMLHMARTDAAILDHDVPVGSVRDNR